MLWVLNSLISTFLISLSLGQLFSTMRNLSGASLVGVHRWSGLILGAVLFWVGAWLLPQRFYVLVWVPLSGLLAFAVVLWAGSFVAPPPHPDALFEAEHPAHGGCRRVEIWDGEDHTPGYLLIPPHLGDDRSSRAAVCVVHGA